MTFAMVESMVKGEQSLPGQEVKLFTQYGKPIELNVGVFLQNVLPDIVRYGDRWFVRQGKTNEYKEGFVCTATKVVEND